MVDGRRYRIGAAEWVAALAGSTGGAATGSSTAVVLGDEQGLLATFELEDTPRPGAADAVRRLRATGLDVRVVSGDAAAPVAALAASLEIATAESRATPAGKLEAVRQLQRDGAVVLMVGDGVNDAPVLGAAQCSLAMGGGTDLARGCADGVILREDLTAVADVVDLAKATRRVMRQNLAWSFAYNLTALPIAMAGLVTPWWAALGMSLSSLVVVLNATRLGRAGAANASPAAPTTAVAAAKPAEARHVPVRSRAIGDAAA